MLDARPRINTLGEVFIPMSFDGTRAINCLVSIQKATSVQQAHYEGFRVLDCKYFFKLPVVSDWGIHLEEGYTLVTDRKLTIDNVEVYVYHTSMGYVVYNETHAILVTHLREIRQYDIKED